MDGFIDSTAKFLNSPPGQLAAGGILAGVVWKFFERVEAVLTDDTKLRIAVWLLDLKIRKKVEPWPQTFSRIFSRVFGHKHLSLKCFIRSCAASYAAFAVCVLTAKLAGGGIDLTVRMNGSVTGAPVHQDYTLSIIKPVMLYTLFLNVIPDYFSLLITRAVLFFATKTRSARRLLLLLTADLYMTAVIASVAAWIGFTWIEQWTLSSLTNKIAEIGVYIQPDASLDYNWRYVITHTVTHPFTPATFVGRFWYFPAFFTSAWLWLYVASGLLLKGARRVDVGFDWFSSRFDVEKKPLQSLGLVAGALVATIYWIAVIADRLIR